MSAAAVPEPGAARTIRPDPDAASPGDVETPERPIPEAYLEGTD